MGLLKNLKGGNYAGGVTPTPTYRGLTSLQQGDSSENKGNNDTSDIMVLRVSGGVKRLLLANGINTLGDLVRTPRAKLLFLGVKQKHIEVMRGELSLKFPAFKLFPHNPIN